MNVLRESIRIFAPSWNEGEIVQLLVRTFKDVSKDIRTDKVGNLIVTLGSGHPIVLFSSHMDTIDQELDFSEDETFINGRGSVDCRSSLVAMALAARRVAFKGFNGTLIFAGIVAEETSLDGIDEFLASSPRPDCAIFGEPTALKICIAYKGRVWIDVRVNAKPGHVAAAWIHVNGIDVIYDLYKDIEAGLALLIKNKKLSPFYTPRATITTMKTDGVANMLPGTVISDIDIRFPPSMKKERILQVINESKERVLEKHRGVDDRLEIDVRVKSQINGIRVPTDNDLCKNLGEAVREITNQNPKFVKKTGTTFMNSIGDFFKCPVVTFGPGDPSLEHCTDECIEKAEFFKAIDILENFIEKMMP
ncbi:MAG: M20/M25/M40 family metallo-hydrolase [Promethearchaeota archaeon]